MRVENKEIRGWILRILDRFRPDGTSFEVIESVLLDSRFNVTLNELKAHLVYLTEKGYVRLDEIERNRVKRRINYITPKGVDLLEGNIPEDPGVMQVG